MGREDYTSRGGKWTLGVVGCALVLGALLLIGTDVLLWVLFIRWATK